jgi:uncharacterized delta-60 repeat protein
MFLRALRFGSALVVVCVCFSVAIEPAIGAPGDLDRSFGQNGVTELPFDPAKRVYANDVAAAPDGGLYVLRTFYEGGETRLERLRPDGSLDPSFGSNGSVAVPGSGRFAGGSSPAVTADGKAIVAGPDFLTRLHPDGSLDGSFGRGGFLMLGNRQSPADPIGGSDITGVAFAIQADGRIVAAVDRGREVGNPVLELSRYLPDGAPDPSFGGGAPIRTDVEKGQAGIALLDDGGLAVAGNPCCFQSGQARVLSLLADGSPDGAFGDAGLSPINNVSEPVRVTAAIAQPDGKIIVAAAHENGPHGAFLLRFLANGKRDPSFGRRGLVSLSSDLPPAQILLDRHGRLTLVEALRTEPAVVGGSGLVTLVRLTPSGSVDRTFGGGQPVRLFRLRSATAIGATFARKGRIAVLAQTGACIRECTPFHSYLAQYIGGSSSARCFGKRATVVGTARRDVLEGTPHRDVIAALGGDDTVRARGGNDLICGGRGNDNLFGGRGRDRLRR